MNERLQNIDLLRGLAAISVCWFHLTRPYPEGSLVRISGQYCWLGVEVFFVISGFIIPYVLYRSNYKLKDHFGRFLLKRISRLYPPYIISIILVLALWHLSAITPGFKGNKPDYSTYLILSHLVYLTELLGDNWLSPVWWTLAIEFQFYILISLIFPIFVSKVNVYSCFWVILLCIASLICHSKAYVFSYLSLFSLGIVTFQFRTKFFSPYEYILMLFIVSYFSLLSLGTTITMVGLATALAIAFMQININKFFLFLGSISYSLYLIHPPIGRRIVNLGSRFATSDIEYVFISIFALLISVLFAYYFYKYIEKPSQKLSSEIKYK